VLRRGRRTPHTFPRLGETGSTAVTRGLRQGHAYTLTLNGEPLAKMIPIRRRQAVPKDEVLAIFAAAPQLDVLSCRTLTDLRH
jgi:antitoxin (DNA-binding transcriptional repressor) of toxin-antitoxin stability system